MRLFIAAAILFVAALIGDARAQSANGLRFIPLGYCQLSAITTATSISSCTTQTPGGGTVAGVPPGAQFAFMVAETNAIRYLDIAGEEPSSTVGFPLAALTPSTYAGTISALQFVPQTAPATINILFYK
jgi:hypothetical protein